MLILNSDIHRQLLDLLSYFTCLTDKYLFEFCGSLPQNQLDADVVNNYSSASPTCRACCWESTLWLHVSIQSPWAPPVCLPEKPTLRKPQLHAFNYLTGIDNNMIFVSPLFSSIWPGTQSSTIAANMGLAYLAIHWTSSALTYLVGGVAWTLEVSHVDIPKVLHCWRQMALPTSMVWPLQTIHFPDQSDGAISVFDIQWVYISHGAGSWSISSRSNTKLTRTDRYIHALADVSSSKCVRKMAPSLQS